MSSSPVVIILGLAFIQSLMPPGFDCASFRATMNEQEDLLRLAGYIVHDLCTLIPDEDHLTTSVVEPLKQALEERKPDVVVIGFGVRG